MSDKDSFTGTIVGTVEKVGQYAKGNYARIVYKTNPAAQWGDKATAWGVDSSVREGDRVKVTGQVSVRKSERDGKTYVDTSINFPTVELVGGHTAAPSVDLSDATPF